MNVKVKSEEIIIPSSPTPSHLRYLPASLIDHANHPIFTPLIFVYSKKKGTTATEHVLDQLKGSLPHTLSVFYPLAGRIHDDGRSFICNDEGVPYMEAVADKPLMDVVHKMDVTHLDKLLPSYGQHDSFTSLLLAIQVSSFACGGLAIGVKMNHAISDVFGLSMFVKAWASMAKYGNHHSLSLGRRPCFESWKIFPPPPSPQLIKQKNIQVHNTPVISKWFMFNEATLNSLRSNLIAYIDDTYNKNSMCDYKIINSKSLAMVLSAFIYTRINAACYNNNNKSNIILREVLHQVHIRHMVSTPVHDHDDDEKAYYFGNMVVPAIAKPSDLVPSSNSSNEDDECLCMYDFLKSAENSIEKITGNEGSFVRKMKEGKEDLSSVKEHYERKRKGEVVSMRFSNLRSLPVYETDFGWGKPVWVTFGTSIMFKDLVILINDGPSRKNIVAYVCLSCEDMAKLESDAHFNAAVSRGPSIRTSKL